MTRRDRRTKRSPKPQKALRRAPDISVALAVPSKPKTDDVTARLNAVYGADPESSVLDPLLSELQFLSLRAKW
jgi:hypothetical protein